MGGMAHLLRVLCWGLEDDDDDDDDDDITRCGGPPPTSPGPRDGATPAGPLGRGLTLWPGASLPATPSWSGRGARCSRPSIWQRAPSMLI